MTARPLPCPFCGGEMTKSLSEHWRHLSNLADCLLIDVRFKDIDIPSWNRRALCGNGVPATELEAEIEKMRGDYVTSGSPGPLYGAGYAAACKYWADRLHSLIKAARD